MRQVKVGIATFVLAIGAALLAPSAKADFGDADFPSGLFTSGPKSYIGNSSVGSLVLSADEGNSGSASRIEMKVDGDEKMRIDSNGLVGIGTSAMSSYNTNWNDLVIDGGTSSGLTVVSATTGIGTLAFADGTTGNEQYRSYLQYSHNNDELSIGVAGALAATIDSSRNLKVGYSSTGTPGNGNTDTGHLLKNDGRFFASSASNSQFNRNSDGDILTFRESGNSVGSIGATSGDLYIDGAGGQVKFYVSGSSKYEMDGAQFFATTDNANDLGAASFRWDDVYATNGTIQTSDRNEKQDIEELSDAEQRVAVAAKGLLRKFRWIDSVEAKGDEARIHFGIIAQDLQDAFTAEGLDAGRYAMFINSTWTDEETGEERSRMGVRYSELLAFIIAAI